MPDALMLVTWHISRLKKDGYIWYVSWMPFRSKNSYSLCYRRDDGNQVIHWQLQQGKSYKAKSSITYNHFSFWPWFTIFEWPVLREVIRISKVTQSMGAIGDSYDNAMAESLWASLKKELVYKRAFRPNLRPLLTPISPTNWVDS